MQSQPAAIDHIDAFTRPAPDHTSGEAGQCLLIHNLLKQLRADIQAFRDEIHGDLQALRTELKQWNDEALHARA